MIANGQLISLDQVATFEPQLELYQLRRLNQKRQIKISAKSETLSGGQLLAFIQPKLDALNLPPAYNIEIAGETKESAETNAKLAAGMPAALTVMLAALMIGGLSIASLISLFFVPGTYYLLFRFEKINLRKKTVQPE